jgi:hypothetical protein
MNSLNVFILNLVLWIDFSSFDKMHAVATQALSRSHQ